MNTARFRPTRAPRAALLLALTIPLAASPASAQNPYDAEVRTLARDASRQGDDPRGVLPLIEIMSLWDDTTPSRTRAALERLARDRRLSPARKAYVRYLLTRAHLSTGQLEAMTREFDQLGFVTDWQVVGPFDNEGRAGFAVEYGPERERLAAFAPGARYPGREREVGWRINPGVSELGYVNFDAVFRPFQNTCGYALTTIHVDEAKPLTLNFGAGGAIKVFWNGEQVYADPITRSPYPERSAVGVGARAGANRLLVKACITEQNWGFFMRIGDARGGVTTDFRADASEIPTVEAGMAPGVTVPTVQGPLEALLAAVPGDGDGEADTDAAQALEDAALFLSQTGADDPAENPARQFAARAADIDPSVERLMLAAELSDQRSDAMRFTQRAAEQFPNDPESLLLQARVRRSSLTPEEALPVLDRLERARPRGTTAVEAKVLRASVLIHLDMVESARAILDELSRKLGGSPNYETEHAAVSEATGRIDEAHAHRERAVALRYDDVSTRRSIIGDALRRGDTETVLSHLDIVRTLTDDSGNGLQYVASVYESIGREDEALETFRAARTLCPEDASAIVAEGRFLLRRNQRAAAAATLREALALRPQDAATRELIEQIEPEERADEAFAADIETLLARRTTADGYPITMLQNLTVNTVYENGLGSSFTQVAAQIHDQEGAEAFSEYGIQYDPGAQRVDVRLARVHRADGTILEATQLYEQSLGEPWYRIYYDTRALVVVFPTLEPGDTVELRYRIDDVAHRNLFADYYGDIHFLQGGAPTRHMEYVLRTPESREFFFNEPAMESLRHTQTVSDGIRVDRFVASDVPPLYGEPMMPGATETRPYLHVSTYRTWEEVGHWYWGLIRDQLSVDDELRATVRELVAGAPDLETKVRRIHAWVIDHTRYVGLEFGIHGFKPYRISQIVRRGFGDCKDKASLLYAMFREAGIDAHIVLTRTRRNGAIRDLPASLAVFDHAIAYVPGMDLYIDGTAEYSGITELPQMDQGVTVLHVWPEGAELRRTPVHPADRNVHERTMNVTLRSDQSAELRVEERITGVQASGYRARYRAEGSQEERLERELRELFPGLELDQYEFGDLADVSSPVRYTYTATAPRFAVREGERLRVAPSTIGDLNRSLARTQRRRHALDLGATARYVERRTITLPTGGRASTLPESGEETSPFGTARITVRQNGNRITLESTFELSRDRIEAEQYDDFRAWIQRANRLFEQRVLIEGVNP